MDSKFNVPKLDRNNPLFWKIAIESTATTFDALDHITGNPPPPQDPALATQHNKNRHTLRALILSTVPSDILNLLSIGPDPTPKDLIDAVLAHLQTNTATDHKYLKSEADNLRLTSNMSIDEYVTKHNTLRARMIASQFPNISDETTTVEFMIDGLCYNPDTIDIGRQLLAINPPTVKDFLHQFHRLKSYNMATPSIPPSTIFPPMANQPASMYPPRPPPRRPPYSTPNYPPSVFVPVHSTNNSCVFHRITRMTSVEIPATLNSTAATSPNLNHQDLMPIKSLSHPKPLPNPLHLSYSLTGLTPPIHPQCTNPINLNPINPNSTTQTKPPP